MEKYIYNEQNGLWYELQGDYYLPCLKLPEEETAHIGIFGQRHRRYLKIHRKVPYTSLLTNGKLLSARKALNLLRRSFEAEDGIPRASRMTIHSRDSSAAATANG